MKRISLSILVFCCLQPVCIRAGFQRWTSGSTIGGLASRDLLTVPLTDDYRILASLEPSSSAGIFRSTDHGDTWLASESGAPTSVTVPDLAYVPATPPYILAAAFAGGSPNQGGVYRSEDGGANWTRFTTGFPNADIKAVTADPFDSSRVLAGAVFDGVFISTDRGQTWSASNTGLNNLRIQTLIADPGSPGHFYAGCLSGLYRSTDSGGTWEQLNLPDGSPQIITAHALFPTPGSVVVSYRVGSTNHLVRTTNSGMSWTTIEAGLSSSIQIRAIQSNPTVSGWICIGTIYDGIFCSTNNGGEWMAFSDGLPENRYFTVSSLGYAGMPNESYRLFAGTNQSANVYQRDESIPPPCATPMATRTPTPTPSANHTRTPTPTRTPSPTHSPNPTITPTPVPTTFTFGIEFDMPSDYFSPGDIFRLTLQRRNPYAEPLTLPVFVVLDVGGNFFFWPSWRRYSFDTQTGLDYALVQFAQGVFDLDVIPAIEWPSGTGSADGLMFWGCVMDTQLQVMLSEMIQIEFSYGE